ncbi:hypothetical protein L1887_58543 [Cichorium endivia]|nr:hypothetical protein L1887_58543 [Cichorium endivia]
MTSRMKRPLAMLHMWSGRCRFLVLASARTEAGSAAVEQLLLNCENSPQHHQCEVGSCLERLWRQQEAEEEQNTPIIDRKGKSNSTGYNRNAHPLKDTSSSKMPFLQANTTRYRLRLALVPE